MVDHITLGLSRLAFQFSESTRLKGLISAIMTQGNDLEAAFDSTIAGRALNTAIGAQLDVIGVIVGIGRTVFDSTDPGFGFFGFDEDAWNSGTAYVIGNCVSHGGTYYTATANHTNQVPPNASYWAVNALTTATLGFGEDGDPLVGGSFFDDDSAGAGIVGRPMSDDEYRLKIRAQILRNSSDCSARDLYTSLDLILTNGAGGVPFSIFEINRVQLWNNTATYEGGELVNYGGVQYKAIGLNSGSPPPSINWTTWRNWDSATGYGPADGPVFHLGNFYFALRATLNDTPPTSPNDWLLCSSAAVGDFGAWNSGTSYAIGARVSRSGTYYIATLAGTNHDPATSPTYWIQDSVNLIVGIGRTLTSGELYFLKESGVIPIPAGCSVIYTSYTP